MKRALDGVAHVECTNVLALDNVTASDAKQGNVVAGWQQGARCVSTR
ncbi:MAG: hypothetical protein LH632_13565 [Rhodoferax sp.]|nr:hypothetical protein [Rhodoferax sp.]